MESMIAWILSFMVLHAPPGRPKQYPDAREDEETAKARYASIAEDLLAVVYDPEEPALLPGPRGRAETVAIMLAIIKKESGFRRDVDFGIGSWAKGDGGRSACLMQVQTPFGRSGAWNTKKLRFAWAGDPPEDVAPGYTQNEMTTDRKTCFRAGLRLVRSSFRTCAGMPQLERLRMYTSGSCRSGRSASIDRMALATTWMSQHPAPLSDEEVMRAKPSTATTFYYDYDGSPTGLRSPTWFMARGAGWSSLLAMGR